MNLVFARGRRRRTLRVLPGVIHGLNGRDLLRPDSSHIELPRLIPAILVTTYSTGRALNALVLIRQCPVAPIVLEHVIH